MEATNEKLDAIIKKLRKLQALYEGAKAINSEGEAAAAAFAIQKLLTQYNLTMDQVGAQPEEDPVVQEKCSGYTYKSIGGWWEFNLVNVLCKHNYCRAFVYGRSYKTILIVGKKENMEMVKWLRETLSARYVSFSKTKYTEYKNSVNPGLPCMGKDKFQRAYLMGCAQGLDAKLREQKAAEQKADEQYATQVTALIVRNDAAIDEYVAKQYGKTGTTRAGSRVGSYSAYGEGYKDGKNTEIYKPIAENSRRNTSSVGLLS